MKRSAKIYIIALIWGATLIQLFFNSRVNIEKEVVQTFAASDISEYETDILIWGEYGNTVYDESTIRNILVNTAAEFGITDRYVLSDHIGEHANKMRLSVPDTSQELSVQFVTEHKSGTSFLLSKITLQGMVASETESMRILEDFYEDIGIDYRKSVSVRGSLSGNMNEEDMNAFANVIFEKTGGKNVGGDYISTNKNAISEDIPFTYIVYGYTKNLPPGTYIDGKKVNIRITFDYKPTEKFTDVCVKFVY